MICCACRSSSFGCQRSTPMVTDAVSGYPGRSPAAHSAVTQAQASVKFVGLAHHPQRVKSVLCPPPLLSVH